MGFKSGIKWSGIDMVDKFGTLKPLDIYYLTSE